MDSVKGFVVNKESICKELGCLSHYHGATLEVCHLWLVEPDLSHVSLSCRWAQGVGFTPGLSVQKSKEIYILHGCIEHHDAVFLWLCKHLSLPFFFFFCMTFINPPLVYFICTICDAWLGSSMYCRKGEWKKKTVSMLCNHSAQKRSGCTNVFFCRSLCKNCILQAKDAHVRWTHCVFPPWILFSLLE